MTSHQQRELSSGETISEFRIERTLGVGGFGITYLAQDTNLNIQVAIKEYFPQNAWRDENSRTIHCYAGEADKSFQLGLQRFHKEGQILAQFKHPNIVRVRQMLSLNGTAYLVMDYEHGEELEAYLHRLGRPLTYQEAETIFNPLLDGLRAVHDRGLLHLDIKPENIFLRSDSTPILIDFGGARHHLGQASRTVSFLVASDGYAPNEQYTGNQLQPTTDVYAVGATLYRCITGQVPADAQKRGVALIDYEPDPITPIQQITKQEQYPAYFLQTIENALSMRISTRPQSVRELQQRLFAPFKESEPSPQPSLETPEPSPKNNWIPILVLSGGLIIVLLVIILMKINQPTTPTPSITATAAVDQQQADKIKEQAYLDAQKKQEEVQQKIEEIARREAELKHQQQKMEEEEQKRKAEQLAMQETEKQEEKNKATIQSLIESYTKAVSQNNLVKQLHFYTEPVDYYSKKNADHNFILEDASSYIKHYPSRTFDIQSIPKVDWLSENNALVQFRMGYELWREKDGKTLTGVNQMKMQLIKSGNDWKISSVSSKKVN